MFQTTNQLYIPQTVDFPMKDDWIIWQSTLAQSPEKRRACIWSLGFHTTSSLVCKSLLPQGCRWVPRSLSFSTPLRKWDALYNAIHTSMYKNHPTLNPAKQGVLGQLYHQQKWYASSDRIHVSRELGEDLASSKHQLSSFTSPNHTKPVPFV